MCGRFSLTSSEEQIAAMLADLQLEFTDWAPRYNVAPSQDVLAVLNCSPPVLTPVRWGLIPSWAKDPSIGNRMINARSESLADKPSYRTPFRKKRCLILADGFYEWKKVAGSRSKTPFYFRLKSGSLFGFAGLWETWKSPEDEHIRSATIITGPPNDLVRPIHDRMPVMLQPNDYAAWLSPQETDPAELQPLLRPYPDDLMERIEVTPRVNKPTNDDPACIAPASQGLF